jgi:hypothetical protein
LTEPFYLETEAKYRNSKASCTNLPGGPISTNDISDVFVKLKRRKAPAPDMITYET